MKSGLIPDSSFAEQLSALLKTYDPKHVVVEEPILIHGPLGATLRNVSEEFRRQVRRAVYVRPSEWKPHPMSKEPLKVKSPHERDAIRIGRWFVKIHLQGAS